MMTTFASGMARSDDRGLDPSVALRQRMSGAVMSGDSLVPAVEAFFELAEALSLDQWERQALLDLPGRDLDRLFNAPGLARQIGGAKLQRRVDYALPILRRMLVASRS